MKSTHFRIAAETEHQLRDLRLALGGSGAALVRLAVARLHRQIREDISAIRDARAELADHIGSR
jgi:hypothetical protein